MCREIAVKWSNSCGVIGAGVLSDTIANGGDIMNVIKPGKVTDEAQPISPSEFDGQFRDAIRRDMAPVRKPQTEGDGEIGAAGVNALLQRVAGSTFKEIDRLIDELHGLRDLLQSEGQRVQREIVKYAQLSQAAMKSTKVIAEGMTQLQGAVETTQKDR
jgi:hypothetical protein